VTDVPTARRSVTLLFTDVERSTEIVDRCGAAGTDALQRHHDIVRRIVEEAGGRVFERIGDAAYVAFPEAVPALASAASIHRALAEEDWADVGRIRVRIALDSGELQERDGRFLGRALYRASRIQSLAKGGETLLSAATVELAHGQLPAGHRLRDLGPQRLKGFGRAVAVYALAPAPERDRSAGAAIRVVLVDDYEVVRRGLRGFLELQPDIEIVGEAADGVEALDVANRLAPDVMLMDLVMPRLDGAGVIEALRERQPDIAVVAVTSFAEPERIARATAAGAVGHLLKDAEPEEVAEAIRAAHAARGAPSPSRP
jgi:class 3 adenylate cyclase/CheY-like chemotaxis protein